MPTFWQKPIFWIACFIVLIIAIPISFFYLSKLQTPPFFNSINQTSSTVIIKPGNCLILEDKYCSQAEAIDWTNPAGQKSILVGIRIPAGVSEIPLLMPTDGKVTKAKLPDDSPIKGFQATAVDPNNPNPLWYVVYGDLKFSDMRSPDLKTGEIFGYIQKTGITNAGGYDALFSVLRGVGENTTKAEDEMKKMFPGLAK